MCSENKDSRQQERATSINNKNRHEKGIPTQSIKTITSQTYSIANVSTMRLGYEKHANMWYGIMGATTFAIYDTRRS